MHRPQTTRSHNLLLRLLESLVDNPREIDLAVDDQAHSVNWTVKVAVDDRGTVIGKNASHAKAIQFLMALVGMRAGERYRIKIDVPRDLVRAKDRPRRTATAYNPEDAIALLDELLRLLDGWEAKVVCDETRDAGELSYLFTIISMGMSNDLTIPCDPIGNGNASTALAAIGTLWRAYGQREGVKFIVEARP